MPVHPQEKQKSVLLREENLWVRVDIPENCCPLLTESSCRVDNRHVQFGTKIKTLVSKDGTLIDGNISIKMTLG